MPFRKIVLLGVVAAAFASIVGVILFALFRSQDESALLSEVNHLVRAFDDAVYLDRDCNAAKKTAEEIVSRASEFNVPEPVEVRGRVRLAYSEIVFGTWDNDWEKKIGACEAIVSSEPSVDRAEFLLYWALIKVKLGEYDEAEELIGEAIFDAKQVQDDRTLALAYMSVSELYAFKDEPSLVAENACRGVTVADHHGQKSLKVRTLRNLINQLIYLDNYSETAAHAKQLTELVPECADAKYAAFLNNESQDFAQFVAERYKEINNRRGEEEPITSKENANIGLLLTRLATAYLHRDDFSNARKYADLAAPFLKSANDPTSIRACKRVIRISELDEADDVAKVDKIASTFQKMKGHPDDVFMDALVAAYSKVGDKEKSLDWKQQAVQSRESCLSREVDHWLRSSETFWASELESRKQTEIRINSEAQAIRKTWLLSTILLLGSTACVLLVGSYFLLRREKDSLEAAVKIRTQPLFQAMENARAANRAKSDFLAQINHEIRNPLTAILCYCDLLSSASGKSNDFVRGIESSSNHLRELVNKTLEVSQIESTGLERRPVEFLPAKTTSDICDIMTEQAILKGLKFDCSFGGDHQCVVLSDETKIRQIALNLIGNAVKFTEQGGVTVSIKLNAQDPALVISVVDTGIGIAGNETSKVFERFTKASNGGVREGSGLGLFITSQLIDCLGGEIDFHSELDVGTRVEVTIPVKIVESSLSKFGASDNSDNSELDLGFTKPGKRILIVDDQEMIRTSLALQLGACGALCESAHDVDRTVELVENWNPDLVLLDLQMQEYSGFDVFEKIRQLNSDVPVYAMTGNATAQVETKCNRAGFDGFVAKPFEIKTIVEIFESGKEVS